MDVKGRGYSSSTMESEEENMDLRRGPWTVDEDLTLVNYIANHGEGRWNSLARSAGLKRTGKSCRLRWLNYLRPDVRRGNITLEEQLLILELHSRWGNRWSKIAQYLPGRTDNEIKNYWRTRVQKHAKQLRCDVNSKQFKDIMRYLWMPRLVERIQAAAAAASSPTVAPADMSTGVTPSTTGYHNFNDNNDNMKSKIGFDCFQNGQNMVIPTSGMSNEYGGSHVTRSYTPENSSTAASSDSFGAQVVSPISDISDYYTVPVVNDNNNSHEDHNQTTSQGSYSYSLTSPYGFFNHGLNFQTAGQTQQNCPWFQGEDASQSLWNLDDMFFLQQQLHGSI